MNIFMIKRVVPIMLMYSFGAVMAGSAADSNQPIEIHDLKFATCGCNQGNFAREKWSSGSLALEVGIGDADDWGFGAAGALAKVSGSLIVSVSFQGQYNAKDQNAFSGIIIDYHTPSGYLKRSAWLLGAVSDKRDDFIPVWGKGTKPDEAFSAKADENGRVTLDLAAHAPAGWDNVVRITAMVENTGKGNGLLVTMPHAVPRIEQRRNLPLPDIAIDAINWHLVPLTNAEIIIGTLPPGASQTAFEHFRAMMPNPLKVKQLGAEAMREPARKTQIIIAPFDESRAALGVDHARIARLLRDDKPWRTEQGYCLLWQSKKNRLVAVSMGAAGLAYAISHLTRTIVNAPEPAIAMERDEMIEKPALEGRGIYINIGYGLSSGKLTPDNWDASDWRNFIDRAALSRASFWSWFLWTESEHIYPDTTSPLAEKNRRVFENLRRAVDYGHERGLKAHYLFIPTIIPREITDRHPDWHSKLEYLVDGGICPQVSEADAMAKIVHRRQMDFFKNADAFDIAFYDPGGCMCVERGCRKGDKQLDFLLRQIGDYAALTREINPRAAFGFWTWAVWRYERIHDYSLKDRLIPGAARILGDRRHDAVVIDSFHGDADAAPYFEEARRNGMRTSNFVYQTNIEDGHVFLLPLIEFQRRWARESVNHGINESFLMIMEVNSKYPMAHFGAELFWDPELTSGVLAQRYALQLTRSVDASLPLARGFLALEMLTYNGAVMTDNPGREARRARELFEQALAAAPSAQRDELAYLATTARAYELLFQAVDPRQRGDRAKMDELRRQFIELTRNDAKFSHFGAHQAAVFFDRMTGWVANGFRNGYF